MLFSKMFLAFLNIFWWNNRIFNFIYRYLQHETYGWTYTYNQYIKSKSYKMDSLYECMYQRYTVTWLVDNLKWLNALYASSLKTSGRPWPSSNADSRSPRRWRSTPWPWIVWRGKQERKAELTEKTFNILF